MFKIIKNFLKKKVFFSTAFGSNQASTWEIFCKAFKKLCKPEFRLFGDTNETRPSTTGQWLFDA